MLEDIHRKNEIKAGISEPKSLFENPKRINKISNFCLYNVNTFAQYTADAIHI